MQYQEQQLVSKSDILQVFMGTAISLAILFVTNRKVLAANWIYLQRHEGNSWDYVQNILRPC